MHVRRTKPITLAAIASLATAIAAQEPRTTPERRTQDPERVLERDTAGVAATARWITLETMLDQDVRLAPSREAVREAAEEGDAAERPEADLEDLILDRDGTVKWAILDVGGIAGVGDKTIAVPIRLLNCVPQDDDEATITLDAREEQLKALPAFHVDEARKSGLEAALKDVDRAWRQFDRDVGAGGEELLPEPRRPIGVGEASADREAAAAEAATRNAGEPSLWLASELDEWDVRGSDDDLGSVSKVLVRLDREPKIDFVVVSSGGVLGVGDTTYLVPFRALKVARHDDENVWMLAKSKDALESAPKYEEPEDGVLDAAAATRAKTFWGVEDTAEDRENAKRDAGRGLDRDRRDR